MRYYQKLMLLIVGLHLAGGVATAQVTIGGSVYGGGNKAQVTGMVKVDLEAGTVDKSVYGGGNQAGINGSTVVTITGGTVANNATGETYGVYGGCNANGNVSGDISVSIQGGTLGTENKRLKGIFGGGYGHLTTTGGNVTVTIGDKEGNHTPVLYSDLYGGSALGKVNAGGKKTQVNFLNGTLHGNLYGGGLGKANDVDSEGNITTNNADSGRVNGIVIVNIGDSTQTDDQCQVVLRGRNVYGCNNTNGSPQDSVYVNIYKTAHTSTDLATEDATAYAIEQVFGGGRNANYTAATGKAATVNVYTCDNSVRQVFGGGDAADATGVAVTIYGGHFAQVFGGGNGASEPANIGAGGANTQIHGGYIGQLFGGSNKQGTITGPMRTKVDSEGTCPEKIGEFFGGSNEVPITGDIVTTIECGAGNFGDVYGGSNLADITGNITFNIRGGTIGKVFGGSKGSTDKAAMSMVVATSTATSLAPSRLTSTPTRLPVPSPSTTMSMVAATSPCTSLAAVTINRLLSTSSMAPWDGTPRDMLSTPTMAMSLAAAMVRALVLSPTPPSIWVMDPTLATMIMRPLSEAISTVAAPSRASLATPT